jgi:hypothetical protein
VQAVAYIYIYCIERAGRHCVRCVMGRTAVGPGVSMRVSVGLCAAIELAARQKAFEDDLEAAEVPEETKTAIEVRY